MKKMIEGVRQECENYLFASIELNGCTPGHFYIDLLDVHGGRRGIQYGVSALSIPPSTQSTRWLWLALCIPVNWSIGVRSLQTRWGCWFLPGHSLSPFRLCPYTRITLSLFGKIKIIINSSKKVLPAPTFEKLSKASGTVNSNFFHFLTETYSSIMCQKYLLPTSVVF